MITIDVIKQWIEILSRPEIHIRSVSKRKRYSIADLLMNSNQENIEALNHTATWSLAGIAVGAELT